MVRGIRATSEQIADLNRFSSRLLAREAGGLSRATVASVKRGERVTRVNLLALLEAVARLETARASSA